MNYVGAREETFGECKKNCKMNDAHVETVGKCKKIVKLNDAGAHVKTFALSLDAVENI